jgi:alkylation response protein AidB-like acyl-CoA dehydrogenase
MTIAAHYRSNLRDIFFNLFEVLDIGRTSLGRAPFGPLDEPTAREALTAMEAHLQVHLASCFSDIGLELTLDAQGNVTLPPAFVKAIDAYYEGGWNQFELPEHLGGYGAPPTVCWAAFELLAGANPSVCFYILGNFIAKIIDQLDTPDQKRRYVDVMLKEHWGATMVLTEPDAGSDVGAGLTRARHVAGDEYHLEGVKRFITNGDFDQPRNIVHLVLARPEGAGPGTKGLSLFIVPKYWVEDDGSIGARNGAVVTKLEAKMGIKGSATCELTLGADAPCRGLLVGGVHDGIAQMFHVIEYARMGVGTKSMATLSTAYLNALDYTKLRKQGADLARAADKAAPRVEIIRHPDVRRMLMLQKAFAEGLRSMVLWTAQLQDRILMLGGNAAADARELDKLNDLMLPLIKGYGAEKVYDLLAVSLQCFGGSGFCQDYPIEQYIRDQKIDSLYEGTTHIQALDLFFRKVARDQGKTLHRLLGEIEATIGGLPDDMAVEKAALGNARADVAAIFMAMMSHVMNGPTGVYHVGFQGNRILFALAELVIGWRLTIGAQVARARLGGADDAFYQGKIAAARFYATNVLPGIALARQLIEASDLALLDVTDEAF